MFFDPLYLLLLAPAMVLALWAQWRVRSAYAEASRIGAMSGLTGAQAAHEVMRAGGVPDNVQIEPVQGFMTDHYDPSHKVLRLSPEVYAGRSLAALGIAAHEAGHAIQDARRYPLLVLRNGLVPMASVGSGLAWIIIFAGFVLSAVARRAAESTGLASLGGFLVLVGIGAFSMVVIFQLVNLPVEYDASRRAKIALIDGGLITADEAVYVNKVLGAAALTYVAATLSSVLTLLYFLIRSGLLGGRR